MKRIDLGKCRIAFALLVLITAAGCSSSSSTSNTLKGVVSKGPVHSAVVNIYRISGGAAEESPIASCATDHRGRFSVNLGNNTSDHILVSVAGGTYTDEATGNPVGLGTTLRCAARVTQNREIAITPFTEAVVRNAIAAGNLSPSNIDSATAGVKLHLNGIDPVSTLPVDATSHEASSGMQASSQVYGVTLGALSQHMKDNGASLEDVIKLVQNESKTGSPIHLSASLKVSLETFLTGPKNQTAIHNLHSLTACQTYPSTGIDTSNPPQSPTADQAAAAAKLAALLSKMGNGPVTSTDVISLLWRPYRYVYWDTGAAANNPYTSSDPNGFLDKYFNGVFSISYPSGYIDNGDTSAPGHPGIITKNLRTLAYNVGSDFTTQPSSTVMPIYGMEDTSHCSAYAASVANRVQYTDNNGNLQTIYLLRPAEVNFTTPGNLKFPLSGVSDSIEKALTDSRIEVRRYARCLVDPQEQDSAKGLNCASAYNIGTDANPVQSSVLLSNAQILWLTANAGSSGWLEIVAPEGTQAPDYQKRWVNAQLWANAGYFVVATIAGSTDASGRQSAGHIAVIQQDSRTVSDISTNGPTISQAGIFNFASTNLVNGFSAHIPDPSEQDYATSLQNIRMFMFSYPIAGTTSAP